MLQRLTETVPAGLPMVLSHGDFSVDQLLVDTQGRLTVTDVDNACQAPEALDLSCFAANVMGGRTGDADQSEAVLDELLAGRDAPPAVEWFYAAALLRRCDRPFRRQKKHWPEKSSTILDHVEKVCAPLG
jgi:aminoglycoside phosphotransferase (APT) family kinase protein